MTKFTLRQLNNKATVQLISKEFEKLWGKFGGEKMNDNVYPKIEQLAERCQKEIEDRYGIYIDNDAMALFMLAALLVQPHDKPNKSDPKPPRSPDPSLRLVP